MRSSTQPLTINKKQAVGQAPQNVENVGSGRLVRCILPLGRLPKLRNINRCYRKKKRLGVFSNVSPPEILPKLRRLKRCYRKQNQLDDFNIVPSQTQVIEREEVKRGGKREKRGTPKMKVCLTMLLKTHVEKMSLWQLETILMKTNELYVFLKIS